MPPTTPSQQTTEKVAETILAYYRQANDFVATAVEFATWFDELPAPLRLQMYPRGLRYCLALPPLKRYVLEQRGYSMPAYMSTHLTPKELMHWVDDLYGGVWLP